VYADLRVLAPQEGRSRFQVEFTVLDEVGVLTRVTSAFASHGVSIRSVVQGVGEGGLARLTATTHEACQADLEATLAELSSAPFVAEVHHVNRVEES
jgi:homoserine dehydrogenase